MRLQESRITRLGVLFSTSSLALRFHSCLITRNEYEAQDLRSIEIKVPSDMTQSYVSPGQYCQIVKQDVSGFYAIRSPPYQDSNTFSFICKITEGNHVLTMAEPGSEVQVSEPQGYGYRISKFFDKYKFDFPTTHIMMVACGSGVAPIAAAIDSGVLGFKTTSYNSLFERRGVLYLGVKSEKHIPCKDEFKRWEDSGILVVPICSQATKEWQGRKGYVQDAIKSDMVDVPRNTGAILSGPRGMVKEVKSLLLESGVFEGRILLA